MAIQWSCLPFRSFSEPKMKYAIWILVLLLIILHQDVWYWNDGTLVFGFMPIGLFYHACISVAAGVVWFLACQFAWPASDPEFPSSKEVKG